MRQLYTLALAALVTLTSCSVYRSNPTPDDVYYSPGTPAQETAVASSSGQNGEYYSTPNDNYVRMRVEDPDRWSYFDEDTYDYYGGYAGYGYSPYSAGLSLGFGYGYSPWMMGGFGYYNPFSYWNSYYMWNSCYNPYYGGVVVVGGKTPAPVYTRVSNFNPAGYQNRAYSGRPVGTQSFYSGNSTNNVSNIRRANNYNTNSNYNRPVYSRPETNNSQPIRTAPTNFGGGGGGGGSFRGGGGGGVRPGR